MDLFPLHFSKAGPIIKTMKAQLTALLSTFLLAGCVGYDIPQPLSAKPYTYIKGGDQLGRDTLQNRALVAKLKFPLKGREGNEVLSILGQPQEVHVVERNVAEDWYFIYYKDYAAYFPKIPKVLDADNKGSFLVRLYHDKVIDVVNLD